MLSALDNIPLCHDLDNGKVRTNDVLLEERVNFSSLLLKESIRSGLTRCGFTYLSPIQKNALPLVLTGTSIIAHAKSGTGKTLIYVLSALNRILEAKKESIQCLILAPTREIAKQIYDVFKTVGHYVNGLKVEYFIGGTPLDVDVLKCKECQIAVGAPGRIKHLIELGELKTDTIELLVLDEVDALLNNKEFAIVELASYLPSTKQTIVCTATFSDNVKELLTPISPNIKYITVNEKCDDENNFITSNVLIGIKQYVAPVFSDNTSLDSIRKRNKLVQILRHFKYDQCLIFVNYITVAKGLCNMLVSNSLPALWISSEQNQTTRISTLNKLKTNQCNILVTTDLASRGIDIHNVNLIVNMGIPSPAEVYIHRMGRAGRYGSEGAVITVVHEGAEIEQFTKIISAVSTDPVDLHVLPSEIDENLSVRDLQVIHCVPDANSEINTEEFIFKRNNENQIKSSTAKNKSKKTKKKRKTKPNNSKLKTKNLPPDEEICSTENDSFTEQGGSHPAEETLDKEMEKLVEQYIETIKEKMNGGMNVKIELTHLKHLFQEKTNSYESIEFSDYKKPPQLSEVIKSRDDFDEDDDVFEDVDKTSSIIQYIRLLKKRNMFLDEQKIPCSILQFLLLAKHNKNLIKKYIPESLHDPVTDILSRIEKLIHEDDVPKATSNKLGGTSVRSEQRRLSKRISQLHNDTNEPRSIETVNSIERETCNWRIGRAIDYSPKGSKDQEETAMPVKLMDSSHLPKNCQNGETKYTMFTSTRVQHRNLFSVSTNHEHCVPNPIPDPVPMPSELHLPIRNNYMFPVEENPTAGNVTCPNCHYRFSTSSNMNRTPLLQPISAYVNSEKERAIWQNHFRFIGNHVRSLPFVFDNC